MEKITYVMLTPEGLQQILLHDIERLRGLLRDDTVRLDRARESLYEGASAESVAVIEALENDCAELQWEIDYTEKRHYRLTGYYSDGLPF